MKYVKTITALLMLLFAAAAYGQISKCVDTSGKVVAYGNTACPAGTKALETDIKSDPRAAPAKPAAAAGKSLIERDAEFKKRQIEKQETLTQEQKKTGEEAQRIRACEDSRAYLKNLQAGNRIFKTDPRTGERVVLEDAGYAKEIAAAQQSVAANCK